MKNSYCILPVYTGDVSGVCSALYELGGMVVMHDPSGCNSTYNTHDEIRWYDMDSRIYLSGLSERDAILGNDKKLIDDVCRAAGEQPPKFIALAGSPIPYLNGTDLPAIAEIIEKKTGIPSFAVPVNGMHDYIYGAGKALAEIARRFAGSRMKKEGSVPQVRKGYVNLLGVTPLDFGPQSQTDAMRAALEHYGFKVLSCWAMGDTLETLSHAGEAEINLVVSSAGLETAKVLKQEFGTPCVVGAPVKGYADRIAKALKNREPFPYINDRSRASSDRMEEDVLLIGEPVVMGSLAAVIEQKYHRRTRVLCPLDVQEKFLAPCDCFVHGEEEIGAAFRNGKIIVADPLYRPACPADCDFYPLPHIAFSGRIFLKDIYLWTPDGKRIKNSLFDDKSGYEGHPD